MTDTVFATLGREIQQRKDSVSQYVLSGGVPDYAAYQKQVGAYQELMVLEDIVKELERRLLDE